MVLVFKNLVFTVAVPGTVAVYLPLLIVGERPPSSGWPLVLGCFFIVVGAVIYSWCLWDFAVSGRGTPAPIDAPKQLVVRGLYRYTRNPMYCGVLSVIVGWASIFCTLYLLAYGLVVGACFRLMVVLYEEPHLRREFGEQYDRYSGRVRRWLPWW